MLAVTTFTDDADALAIANDTLYGLSTAFWTRDGIRAYKMGRGIKAGRVWTNCYHQYPAGASFGGYKIWPSQRLAQLGSLVTAAAVVEAQRRAQANAAGAARDEQALTARQDQDRATWQLASARWAPAHDSRWLAQADVLQAVRVWSAAAAYAEADPTAGSAARKCEERLRALHPYAMAWYDRLRSEGAGAFDAMRQALPLFARAPYARPGDPGGQRRALEYDAASRDGDADGGRPAAWCSAPTWT